MIKKSFFTAINSVDFSKNTFKYFYFYLTLVCVLSHLKLSINLVYDRENQALAT